MSTSDHKMADTDEKIFIGKGEQAAWLTLALANRHGLVTGATGTGKTVSLQVMADGQGLLLLDMKDLRAILSSIAEHANELTTQYGNVSKQTVGTIQRQLLVLENQGGAKFFGEPALALKDFMRTDRDGRGMVNILVPDRLMQSPQPYATFR